MTKDPVYNVFTVVVACWPRIFWGQAVLDVQNRVRGRSRDFAAEQVVRAVKREDETRSVEVDQEG